MKVKVCKINVVWQQGGKAQVPKQHMKTKNEMNTSILQVQQTQVKMTNTSQSTEKN